MRKLHLLSLSIFALASTLEAAPVYSATVGSHPFNTNGGGRFAGTLNGDSVSFWCVDNQLRTYIPDSFQAYSVGLDSAIGLPSDIDYDTRYENGTFAYTVNGSTTNAEFRYRMAAYLITLYSEGLGGGHGQNQAIQQSIWKSTRVTAQALNTTYNSVDYFAAAESFVAANYNANLFNGFAVVSGWRSGSLADSGSNQVQTFLTTVPEPGSYALMGTGLMGLLFAVRRRKVRQD